MSSKCRKWGYKVEENNLPTRVCLFISRNKDNKDIEGFHERRKAFLTTKTKDELIEEYRDFVGHGVNGEHCRMYMSVNARDTEKIHKELLKFLIDVPNFDLTHIQGKLASIGAKKECAAEKKWLFDFDSRDKTLMQSFCSDIHNIDSNINIEVYDTPNGYAIITDRGFDVRELNIDGKLYRDVVDVSLKRDDLLLVNYSTTCLYDC